MNCSYDHWSYVDSERRLYICGNGSMGQLGTGKIENTNNIKMPLVSSPIKTCCCAESFTVCLCQNNTLLMFGECRHAQFLSRQQGIVSIPIPIDFKEKIVGISCGRAHSIFSDSNGDIWGFGDNTKAQLGLGTTLDTFGICLIIKNQETKHWDIVCKGDSTMLINNNGNLFCFGENLKNKFGLGADFVEEIVKNPFRNIYLEDIRKADMSDEFSFFITKNGAIYHSGICFWDNKDINHFPTKYSISKNTVVNLACGGDFCIFIDSVKEAVLFGLPPLTDKTLSHIPSRTVSMNNNALSSQMIKVWIISNEVEWAVASSEYAFFSNSNKVVFCFGSESLRKFGFTEFGTFHVHHELSYLNGVKDFSLTSSSSSFFETPDIFIAKKRIHDNSMLPKAKKIKIN